MSESDVLSKLWSIQRFADGRCWAPLASNWQGSLRADLGCGTQLALPWLLVLKVSPAAMLLGLSGLVVSRTVDSKRCCAGAAWPGNAASLEGTRKAFQQPDEI